MGEHSEFLRILIPTLLTSNEASNRYVKCLPTHGRGHVLRPPYARKTRPSWARACARASVCVCALVCLHELAPAGVYMCVCVRENVLPPWQFGILASSIDLVLAFFSYA